MAVIQDSFITSHQYTVRTDSICNASCSDLICNFLLCLSRSYIHGYTFYDSGTFLPDLPVTFPFFFPNVLDNIAEYYIGCCYDALHATEEAARCYHQLKSFGEKHIFDEVSYDYFAVSLPEFEVFPSDIQLRNTIDCKYLMALSVIGLGDYEKARDGLDEVLALQRNHLGAIEHVRYLEEMGV